MVSREATYYRVTAKYIDLSTYNRLITGLYLGYIQDLAELAPLLSRAKSTGQGSRAQPHRRMRPAPSRQQGARTRPEGTLRRRPVGGRPYQKATSTKP